jgi:hypothetical protein
LTFNIIDESGKFLTTRPDAFFKKHPQILDDIISVTNFLPVGSTIQERIFCIIHNIQEVPRCELCGKSVEFKKTKLKYDTFCSVQCATRSDTTKNKRKETNVTRYGVFNVSNVDRIQEQKAQTLLKNYGTINMNHIDVINDKRKSTNILKYGHYNPFGSDIIKDVIKNTNTTRYGIQHIGSSFIGTDALSKLNDSKWLTTQHHENKRTLREIAHELEVDPTTVSNYCNKLGVEVKHFFVSNGEQDVFKFVTSLTDLIVLTNVRDIIPPYELDIVIPELRLAIEYCGLYWHSDRFKSKYYHHDKTQQCVKQGYNLITIFEDNWLNQTDIVKTLLRERLNVNEQSRVYARQCTVKVVDVQERQPFFNVNHIQGDSRSSYSYGLYHDETLVACLSLIRRNHNVYEINRYATSIKVVGGFSKLLHHFKIVHPTWKRIYTFADKSWSAGRLYEVTGFTRVTDVLPSYNYVVGTKRVHRSNFMRKFLHSKLEVFDPNLTEFENCDKNGMLRVWNCGYIKFEQVNDLVDF